MTEATSLIERLEARIYDQEGNLQPFTMKDTLDNRHFAEFLRVHDRYTPKAQEASNDRR